MIFDDTVCGDIFCLVVFRGAGVALACLRTVNKVERFIHTAGRREKTEYNRRGEEAKVS